MANSDIEIINYALSLLKEERITSLSSSTETERLVESVYSTARDVVLSSHNWNEATTRVILSPLSTKPVFGYEYQFQKPSDCIRIVDIMDSSGGELTKYSIEENNILTDKDVVMLRYVKRVTDPSLYTPYLCACIARKLAAELAFTFSGKAELSQYHANLYEQELSNARSLDASQGQQINTYNSNNYQFSILG
jgi:hypothetical protein